MTDTTDIDRIDFDAWNDKKENEAIDALAKASRPRHAIGGDLYIALLPDGTRIKLPLRLSLADVQAITTDPTSDGVDQVIKLLDRIGDKKTTDIIKNAPIATMSAIADDYFQIIGKITNTTLGK